MYYGEKLLEVREMFSYTRKHLAEALDLNEQIIWQYETNQLTPDFQVINELKKMFHVQASYFFKETYLIVVRRRIASLIERKRETLEAVFKR